MIQTQHLGGPWRTLARLAAPAIGTVYVKHLFRIPDSRFFFVVFFPHRPIDWSQSGISVDQDFLWLTTALLVTTCYKSPHSDTVTTVVLNNVLFKTISQTASRPGASSSQPGLSNRAFSSVWRGGGKPRGGAVLGIHHGYYISCMLAQRKCIVARNTVHAYMSRRTKQPVVCMT